MNYLIGLLFALGFFLVFWAAVAPLTIAPITLLIPGLVLLAMALVLTIVDEVITRCKK
jgi:hypothetical protein